MALHRAHRPGESLLQRSKRAGAQLPPGESVIRDEIDFENRQYLHWMAVR